MRHWMISKALVLAAFSAATVLAAGPKPLGDKAPKGSVVQDLPAPFDLQAQLSGRSVALTWQWQPPEARPLFQEFGYDVRRQDGHWSIAAEPALADRNLELGSYTYQVRARGHSRGSKGAIIHVSQWSEPVSVKIVETCTEVPVVELQVETPGRQVASAGNLRLRLRGRISVPDGCTVRQPSYLIESQSGSSRTGALRLKPGGQFDEYVDAVGPEDEMPSGDVAFSVSITASSEAGPASSDTYTIRLRAANKFAPR